VEIPWSRLAQCAGARGAAALPKPLSRAIRATGRSGFGQPSGWMYQMCLEGTLKGEGGNPRPSRIR
jgi:hypothetical protein